MSDGAITPTSQNSACTNCSEQDTITIAGKTFCANCGTPQVSGNAGGSNSTGSTAVSPSLNVDSHTPSAAPPSEPMPLSSSASSSASQSAGATDSGTLPAQSPVVIQSRLKADQLDSALNTEQSPSIAKFSSNTAQSTALGDDAMLAEERSASEFTNLDDKTGESVMSDETLDELARAAEEPMPREEIVKQQAPLPDVLTPEATQASAVTPQASMTSQGSPAASPSVQQPLEPKPQVAAESTLSQLSSAVSQTATVQPATAQSATSQANTQSAPRQSNYRLDLTQAGASSLPKAVSDIRPAAASTAPVSTPSPTTPPVSTGASSTSQVQSSGPQVAINAQAPRPASVPAPSGMAGNTPANALPVQLATPSVPQPAVASVAANSSVPNSSAAATAPSQSTPSPAKGLKASSVALSLVGLLLIGGYIWQVNYPNLALKVAGSKAGISANFPGYIPNGWKLSGNIQSSPGNISYNIANNKNGTSLQVSESKTEWDSQALAENYVAPKASNYLALQAQGLTIYLYDGNQASWVNNGTWYRIEGSASGLSQDQIIKVATSL